MNSTTGATLILTTFALAACGGAEPPPQAPPPAPPPPVAMTAATTAPTDTAPPPPAKPSLAELIPQSLKGIDDAFNAHDAKKAASYYSDDCVVQAYVMPDGHGRDEVAKGLQMVFDISSDAKAAETRVWMKGNVVVSEMAWSGTMTGDFMGTKATKKPLGQTRLHVMWFNDDGLVKEMHEYADGAGLMAQMKGAKLAPPVPALPTSPPEMHMAKMTPDEDKLADWAKASDDAFNKDDPNAALAGMADDSDYWINFGGPAAKGKKDMTKSLTAWFKAFPDQKWTVSHAWGIDGFGIVEHTMTGTQKGPVGPLPASGKMVSNWHWLDVLQPATDGKVQHGWGYANLAEMMIQTGAMKQPSDKAAMPKADAKTSAPAAQRDAGTPKTDTTGSPPGGPKSDAKAAVPPSPKADTKGPAKN